MSLIPQNSRGTKNKQQSKEKGFKLFESLNSEVLNFHNNNLCKLDTNMFHNMMLFFLTVFLF